MYGHARILTLRTYVCALDAGCVCFVHTTTSSLRRFTTFPQEIVIAMEEPVHIQQIQILSHEYKIATKVEVHVGTPSAGDPEARRCNFRRLGYLSFDSNRRSNFQARELKSVMLNTVAQVVKLVPHRCHVNSLNIYNQVGIIALNIVGEKVPASGAAGFGAHAPRHAAAVVPTTADITLDLQVDRLTAEKIRKLEIDKRTAVTDERYDDAKFYKDQIDKLRMLGKKIAELEAHKRRAVEVEDYSTAKVLKAEVDRLRAAGADSLDAVGAGPGGGGADGGGKGTHQHAVQESRPRIKDPMQLFNRVLPPEERAKQAETILSASQEGIPALHAANFQLQPNVYEPSGSPEVLHSSPPAVLAAAPIQPPSLASFSPLDASPPVRQDVDGPVPLNAYVPHDEKLLPVPARAQGLMEPASQESMPPEEAPPTSGSLPAPEAISGPLTGEAEPFIEMFGEHTARCLFSRNWQLRESGVDEVCKCVIDGSVKGGREASYSVTARLLSRVLKDRVPGVFHAGVRLLDAMVEHIGPEVGERTFQSRIGDAVQRLIDRLGDVNQRVRAVSGESIQMLANHEVCGLGVVASFATKPVKAASAAKPLIGRLEVLNQLVETHGMNVLTVDTVMPIARAGLDHQSGEVRDAAIQLTTSANSHVGDAVEKYLNGLKPALRELLNAEISGEVVAKKGTPGLKAKSKVQSFASAPPPKKAPQSRPAPAATNSGKTGGPAPPAQPSAAVEDDELPPRSESELPGLKKHLVRALSRFGC